MQDMDLLIKRIIDRAIFYLKVVFVFCVVIPLIFYAFDVGARMSAHSCRYEKSTEDHGKYTAEICYTRGHSLRLRLYKTGEKELLAERMLDDYPNDPSIDPITWFDNEVLYDRIDGSIKLPPTRLDWFRARLP